MPVASEGLRDEALRFRGSEAHSLRSGHRYRTAEPARRGWVPMISEVSVVATVLNEVASIGSLVEALMAGSRLPDEILITDAGSTDGTWEELQRLASMHSTLKPLRVPGNRSAGRNAAIGRASHDVIACIDGGCTPHPGWLAELVAPFEEGAVWVGGFYEPVGSTRQISIGLTMVFVLEEARSDVFLPSARSMAFSKAAWARVGGFPEHLEVSEDTAFGEAMRSAGFDLVFRPEALVDWVPPRKFREQARVLWKWSRSDGVAGIREFGYLWSLRFVKVSGIAVVVLALLDVRLAPLGLIPLVFLMGRQTRYKYRWATGFAKYLWIPCAWLVGLVSSCGGFIAGARERRRHRVGNAPRSRDG